MYKSIHTHLKIFISSTFKDMYDERQKLITNVFIKFRKLAKQRGVEVTEIELRTGVTNATGHIAKVCLEQVDRCMDSPIFFLGILGSYYGWDEWYEVEKKESLKDEHRAIIEKYPKISITELEIRYAIDNPKHNQALFYVTEPIEDEEQRLVALKEELKGYAKERDNLGFDYYESDEEFAQKVYSDLEIAFDKIYPPNQELSEVEKLRVSHEAFALSRYKGYVRYEENEKILYEFLSPYNHHDRLLLYGKSGYGKSALVANYFKRFKKESSAFVIEHYIGGAGDISSDFYAMLRRVMLEIKEEFSIEEDVPTEHEEIINKFGEWLQKVKRQTVIVLDGYNQIEDEVKERFLKYYLSVKFEKVKLIVTSIKSDYAIANKKEITKLNRQKQKELVEKYLGIYGKKLTYDVDELLKHDITDNTLFLRTLLEEIRLLGVYESISADIAEYLKAKDLKELFVKIFIRYERDYDAVLIREVLSLLYNSRDGLSQNNLLEIIEKKQEVDRYKFYPMILALEEHLVNHSGLYRFFHDYIKMAVESRYVPNDELKKHYKRELVDYFEKQEIDNQRVRELPYLLLSLEDREGLYDALVVVEFFVAVQELDEYELLGYVRFVDEEFDISEKLVEELLKESYTNSTNINNIALFIHKTYAKYQKSIPLYQKVIGLDIDEQYINYNNLALLYKEIGENRKALALYEKILNFYNEKNLDTPIVYNNLAQLYQAMGELEQALSCMKKSLKLNLEFWGENSNYTAISYDNLSLFYYFMGKYHKSLSFSKKALEIREKVLSKDHPSIAMNYNDLANLYKSLGEYEKVLPLYNKAIEIQERVFGKNHPNIAITYSNLANYYYFINDYNEAISLHQKAIDIREKSFGEYHSDTASSYDSIAMVYALVGKYALAEQFYKKALDIREKILGKEHNNTAVSYNNLAEFYKSRGKYQEAMALFENALEISQKSFGEYHTNIATIYDNMARLYQTIGEYKKALPLFEKSLKIRKKIFGLQHNNTATSYNNLAIYYHGIGEYQKAISYFQKALSIRKKVFGLQHTETVSIFDNLAELYRVLGKNKTALSLSKKALKIREKVLGKEHPNTAVSYSKLGLLYEALGEYNKALPLMEQSLQINRKLLGEEHINTAISYNNLGLIYDSLEKYKESLEYYQKALKIKEKKFKSNHPSIAMSYNNLATIYAKIGEENLALKFHKKAIEIREEVLGIHFDTGSSYNNISILYYRLGEYRSAFLYMQKAIEIWDKILDKSNPHLVGARESLREIGKKL